MTGTHNLVIQVATWGAITQNRIATAVHRILKEAFEGTQAWLNPQFLT